MDRGELKARRRRKALNTLQSASTPRMNTTDALWALNAACGAARFHRILERRGLASRVTGFDGGYEFHLAHNLGGGTSALDHHSFRWSPAGLFYIAQVLTAEGIGFEIPDELRRWSSTG